MYQTARSPFDVGAIAEATPSPYRTKKLRRFRNNGHALPGSDTSCCARSIPTSWRRLVVHAIAAQTAAARSQSAIRTGDDIDRSASEVNPHPMNTAGVISRRHIGNVRGLSAWMPSQTSRPKSANTHQGVCCKILRILGTDRDLL